MSNGLKEMLLEFSKSYGPPGREEGTRKSIAKWVKPYCDKLETDRSGNLIAVKYANGERKGSLMITTHMDEVCMVVSKVLEEGYLRVEGIGLDPKLLPSQKVNIHTRDNRVLRGVIGMLAPHLQTKETKNKVSDFDALFVDCSMHDIKNFHVGDFITYEVDPLIVSSTVFTKTTDNRASCAASVEALRMLQHFRHDYDVYAVFSSREEVGAFGARTAASLLQPDAAIVVDMTFADEKVEGYNDLKIGDGPAIGKGPVPTRKVTRYIERIAEQYNIKTQVEPVPGRTGTDADQVQLEGIPVGLLSIPQSYMHNPYEKIELNDIKETGRLIAHLTCELKESEFCLESKSREGER